MLALLQQAALRDLTVSRPKGTAGFRETLIAEARCRDLALIARLLIEQEAMCETAHELGDDHPADLTACRLLYWAAEEALEGFDRKLEAVTPAQLNQAFRRYIDPSKITTVRAGDFAKKAPPAQP